MKTTEPTMGHPNIIPFTVTSYTSGMETDSFEATDPGHEWGVAMRSVNLSALNRHR